MIAQDGGIHRDVLLHAAIRLTEGDGGAQQGVVTRLDAGTRAAATRSSPEERLENVAQAAAETTETAARGRSLLQRVTTHVHDASLLGVEQNFLRNRNFPEFRRGFLRAIHIRVVLAGQRAVRLFNLSVRSRTVNSENAVIVTSHSENKLPFILLVLKITSPQCTAREWFTAQRAPG